jgi:signal transduction histidine kinase
MLKRSLHYRLAALYTGMFSLSVLALGVVVTFSTRSYLLEQLKTHVESSTTQLLVDYNEDGIDELRHDIQERIDADDPDRLWYFVGDPAGRISFDALSLLPAAGWHQVNEHGHILLLKVVELKDGYRLGVGTSLDKVRSVEEAVRRTFLSALVATLALGALGGFLLGRGFLGRLETIKTATARFGEGDLSYRAAASGSGDEFDQISLALNSMFERIESLVSEVKRVTSNIAHDLRTPLGRVKQKIEALEKREDISLEAKQTLEQVSGALDETLATFSALLRIAEVESGTRRAEFRAVRIADIFEQVASAYEAVAEESGRGISFRCDSSLEVLGDRALLTQALVNLVENSIQHTPPGCSIEVGAREIGGSAEITVGDNGPGIEASERENVLRPFFKLDRSRQAGRGSGLGLSLVAAVVQLHEGGLALEDNAPGTRVRIHLPIRSKRS